VTPFLKIDLGNEEFAFFGDAYRKKKLSERLSQLKLKIKEKRTILESR